MLPKFRKFLVKFLDYLVLQISLTIFLKTVSTVIKRKVKHAKDLKIKFHNLLNAECEKKHFGFLKIKISLKEYAPFPFKR